MPLNDRQIKNAKPAATPYTLADGRSLYLRTKPNGSKYWRLDDAFDGKRKTLAIGTYLTISLVEVREAAENARHMVANGGKAPAKQAAKTHTTRPAAKAILNHNKAS